MQIEIIRSLEDAHKATGLTVVIDVFRAFTTEAYIFANGAEKIIPVLSLEEAYKLKQENPEYLLVGERKGVKPEGFDFGNGPTEVLDVDFSGKTIVHTTQNGTRGLVNAVNADMILAGSFVLADSIIKYIKNSELKNISFVSTAHFPDEDNEDILLAYYMRDVLNGKEVNEGDLKHELATTSVAKFLLTEAGVSQSDIDLCLDFHRFNFVIKKILDGDSVCLVREDL